MRKLEMFGFILIFLKIGDFMSVSDIPWLMILMPLIIHSIASFFIKKKQKGSLKSNQVNILD